MKFIFKFILLISLPFMANAQDYKNGEQLHAEQCVKCHDDSVYTRANRRVKTLQKLNAQVHFCKNNIGIQWFDDEVNDVVEFLNKKYYHF